MTRSASPSRSELPPEFARSLARFLAARHELSIHTTAAYGRDLHRYLASLAASGLTQLAEVDDACVSRALSELPDGSPSAATAARFLCSIRLFHEHLQRRGVCLDNPVATIAAPRVVRAAPHALSVSEAARLVTAVSDDEPLALRDRALLELLYACGLKVCEVTAMRPSWLDLHAGLLSVAGKGRRRRQIPVGLHASAALDHYESKARPQLAAADEEAFFVNARGRSLSRMGVWKIIRAAALAAGMGGRVNANTLRNTFAAHLLQGGAGLQHVQRLLGHRVISTTQAHARSETRPLHDIHRDCHPRG